MSLATVIRFVLMVSIFLTVFGFGLASSLDDVLRLLRRPSLLLRSLFAMNVVMPVLAVATVATFDLTPPVKIALVALALSPVPPLVPQRQLMAGGSGAYAYGLLFIAGLLAIVIVPVGLLIVAKVRALQFDLKMGSIVGTVLTGIVVPFLAGIVVHRLAPVFSEKARKPLSLTSMVLIVLGLLPILFVLTPSVVSVIGNGTILVLVAFVAVGLAVGHLLGGPVPQERSVLAIATAVRHPAIALAIATMTFPDQKLVPAAVLLYLFVNVLVSLPYLRWRQRSSAPAKTLRKRPA